MSGDTQKSDRPDGVMSNERLDRLIQSLIALEKMVENSSAIGAIDCTRER